MLRQFVIKGINHNQYSVLEPEVLAVLTMLVVNMFIEQNGQQLSIGLLQDMVSANVTEDDSFAESLIELKKKKLIRLKKLENSDSYIPTPKGVSTVFRYLNTGLGSLLTFFASTIEAMHEEMEKEMNENKENQDSADKLNVN